MTWNSTLHSYTRLARRTGLKVRKAWMERRVGLNPVNRERRAKLHERNFGDKAAWIRSLPCCVPPEGIFAISIRAHHARSRGAGGDSSDLVPLCHYHHRQVHALGAETFERKHGIDLRSLAAEYERRWQEEQR